MRRKNLLLFRGNLFLRIVKKPQKIAKIRTLKNLVPHGSLQGPTLCRWRLSITSLQVTLKSMNSFVNLRQLTSVQSRCFIIQSFLLQCYFMSYCIAVCLQVGKMAVRCHASFFRAGKSTPSSLSLKLPPGRDSEEECREAFLKCLCLTALSKSSPTCYTLEWRNQNFNW